MIYLKPRTYAVVTVILDVLIIILCVAAILFFVGTI